MKFNILSICWLVVSSLFCPLANSAGLPDIIDRIRPGVVAVGTIMPLRRPSAQFMGTGFAIGDGRLVISNHHVIPELIDLNRKERLAVFSGRGDQAKVHPARVVKTDPDHDLVVLEISNGPLPAVPLATEETVREGESVAFTGFPIGMVLGLYPVTHRGIISAITPVVIPSNNSRSLTAKQIQRMRNRFEVYQLDGTAYPGNSGSPVYDARSGRVVGVLNSVFVKGTKETVLERPSGISYAIPIKYVHELLKGESNGQKPKALTQ
ncbi:S1 family peptidase [Sedimenticola hydrogenitrophicus]|uniref:S1 family peptidase n=1 Tax=Sedimenticola hydrogenitrophicus TaxID=2967975 RepID=UPI0021A96FF7|nr:serine protease [Sedimenticola hydrogenitrophicus]